MSKRRINKQQSARIKKNQENFQNINNDQFHEGLVITRFRNQVEVEDKSGNTLLCSIRPNLETVVAGDHIIWQKNNEEQGVVVSLCPRKNVLARTNGRAVKPVAANISQLIIVIATKPEISWLLLDSYLVLAENLSLKATIVLNKIDLKNELQQQEINRYRELGYEVIPLSTYMPETMKELNKKLNNQISVFIGQSGVGKSSIISYFLPHINNIAVGELSENIELGRHTTSNSSFYHLPDGGALIDSPGVREFQLTKMSANEIIKGFTEIRPWSVHCKYRNCNHMDSKNCAIINAVNKNLISALRYANFVRLYQQSLEKTFK